MIEYPAYLLVESAIGAIPVGGNTDSTKIGHETEVIPPQVHLYTRKMNCISFGPRVINQNRGLKPQQITRTSNPGDVCNDCQETYHCILLLIKQAAENKQLLPEAYQNSITV